MILNFQKWKRLSEQTEPQASAPAKQSTSVQVPPKPDANYFYRGDLDGKFTGRWQYEVDQQTGELKLRITIKQDNYYSLTFYKDGSVVREISGDQNLVKQFKTPMEGLNEFFSNSNLSDNSSVGHNYANMVADIGSTEEKKYINTSLWNILKNTVMDDIVKLLGDLGVPLATVIVLAYLLIQNFSKMILAFFHVHSHNIAAVTYGFNNGRIFGVITYFLP
jgi:hypothetical protein